METRRDEFQCWERKCHQVKKSDSGEVNQKAKQAARTRAIKDESRILLQASDTAPGWAMGMMQRCHRLQAAQAETGFELVFLV